MAGPIRHRGTARYHACKGIDTEVAGVVYHYSIDGPHALEMAVELPRKPGNKVTIEQIM
ncbi:MAG: hypothetical protein IH830_03355 [Planctomycetes bacterium]|nr:hypothetical protein [Planctomycetota bacterium]